MADEDSEYISGKIRAKYKEDASEMSNHASTARILYKNMTDPEPYVPDEPSNTYLSRYRKAMAKKTSLKRSSKR